MAKICGVVTGRTVAECSRQLKLAKRDGADAAELRLDYLQAPSPGAVKALVAKAKALGLETIVTCRPEWEGGKFRGSENKRKGILLEAVGAGPGFVDVELRSGREFDEVVKAARAKKVGAIISFHDFKGTPPVAGLLKIFAKELARGADVGKVACLAEKPGDAARLLELLARKKGKKIIVVGMGGKAVAVRVLAAVQGSQLAYACIGTPSAAGQLSVEQMVRLVKEARKVLQID